MLFRELAHAVLKNQDEHLVKAFLTEADDNDDDFNDLKEVPKGAEGFVSLLIANQFAFWMRRHN